MNEIVFGLYASDTNMWIMRWAILVYVWIAYEMMILPHFFFPPYKAIAHGGELFPASFFFLVEAQFLRLDNGGAPTHAEPVLRFQHRAINKNNVVNGTGHSAMEMQPLKSLHHTDGDLYRQSSWNVYITIKCCSDNQDGGPLSLPLSTIHWSCSKDSVYHTNSLSVDQVDERKAVDQVSFGSLRIISVQTRGSFRKHRQRLT